MTNYLFINFYLRKSKVNPLEGSVYVRTTINRQRITLGTVTTVSGLDLPASIMISQAHWDIKKKRVRQVSPHALILNRAITECENKLQKLYAQHEGFDVAMTAKGVKASMLHGAKIRPSLPDLMGKFIDERMALNTKTSTIDTYKFKFRPLLEFLKQEGSEEKAAEEFTPGTLKRYRTYLIAKRGNSHRSADKTCQVVKTVLIWAAENELIRTNPLLFTPIRVDKTPNLECLNQEEVQLLLNASLEPRLRQVADCFIFACYTGLAYQDLASFTEKRLQYVEGSLCIVGDRQKTGTGYYIPVTPIVSALLSKYNNVLPLPGIDDYNVYLKQIMYILGINKKISSHTARKTFADWCINEIGMSEEATIVAMGQKSAKELTPYRKTRPKRLLSEFPSSLLQAAPSPARLDSQPFSHIYKAS